MAVLEVGSLPCTCHGPHGPPGFVVLTGGPGAGKTAVLEMARRALCAHVALLPEAASIAFGGGFPRHPTLPGRRAAQRAIFHLQREVERLVVEEGQVAMGLCDRGSIDGLAYWPGSVAEYWRQIGTSLEAELARYRAVIHLTTPPPEHGYNHDNALRIETAREAAAIDDRILEVWSAHPRRYVLPSTPDFLEKALEAIELIRLEMPACCTARPTGA